MSCQASLLCIVGELTEGGSVDVAVGVAVALAVAVAVGLNGFGATICTRREIQYSGFLTRKHLFGPQCFNLYPKLSM